MIDSVYMYKDIGTASDFAEYKVSFTYYRYQLASNGSLLVIEVTDKKQDTDAGWYQCSATVDDGQTILSQKAHVKIAG